VKRSETMGELERRLPVATHHSSNTTRARSERKRTKNDIAARASIRANPPSPLSLRRRRQRRRRRRSRLAREGHLPDIPRKRRQHLLRRRHHPQRA
jgi:hypothetical protein